MKKFILFLMVSLLFAVTSCVDSNVSTTDPVFPFGSASFATVSTGGETTVNLTVNNTLSYVTINMDTAITVNVTTGTYTRAGSQLVLKLVSDATGRDATPGTGMSGTAVAGANSKTKVATYVYDGTNFVHTATQQIN